MSNTSAAKLASSRAWKAANRERVKAYMHEWHIENRASGKPTGRPVVHGMSQSREWRSWAHAKDRVTRPGHHAWKDYGGRGIRMCSEWLDDFAAFYAHMGPRPDGTSLDRIDPDGDYAPANCRWATPVQQNNNRRQRRT